MRTAHNKHRCTAERRNCNPLGKSSECTHRRVMTDNDDEVKVFRKSDNDDDATESTSQIREDRLDVAFEAEVELDKSLNVSTPQLSIPPQPFLFTPSPIYGPLQGLGLNSPCYLNPMLQAMSSVSQMCTPIYPVPGVHHAFNTLMQHQQQQQSLQSKKDFNSSGGPMKVRSESKENRMDAKNRIKKPLNAYMLFMREKRVELLKDESNATKQSSELNSIMGKMWNQMNEEEQKPYFEMAKKEKEDHEKKYPGWSARENYALKKKKVTSKRVDRSSNAIESKKCRARYGIDNQDKWCRYCKRKKRCVNAEDEAHSESSSDGPSTPTTSLSDISSTPGSCVPSSAMAAAAAAAAFSYPLSASTSAQNQATLHGLQSLMASGVGLPFMSNFGFPNMNVNAMMSGFGATSPFQGYPHPGYSAAPPNPLSESQSKMN